MGGQHILEQQAVQVLPGLDLILLRAVLVLQQEVLAEARLVLADRRWRTEAGKETVKSNSHTRDAPSMRYRGRVLEFV